VIPTDVLGALTANPRTQHGTPALLAKPVCGMMGLPITGVIPYLTAKLGAR